MSGGRTCLTPLGPEVGFEPRFDSKSWLHGFLAFTETPLWVQGGQPQPTTRPDFPGPRLAGISHLAFLPRAPHGDYAPLNEGKQAQGLWALAKGPGAAMGQQRD